jgi:hypothetical protein
MNEENRQYCYTGYLTVTNVPQPLSAEWGEDEEATAVDVQNPLSMIAAGTSGGGAVAVDADAVGSIRVGSKQGQHKEILPGGSTGIIGVLKLSDIWVRTKTSGDSFRIAFDIYKDKDDE